MKKIVIISMALFMMVIIQAMTPVGNTNLRNSISVDTIEGNTQNHIENWTTVVSGTTTSSGFEGIIGMATDSSGSTYILGSVKEFAQVGNISVGGIEHEAGYYLAKMTSNGSWNWVVDISNPGFGYIATDIALGTDGWIYVSGAMLKPSGDKLAAVWVYNSSTGSLDDAISSSAGDAIFNGVEARQNGGFYAVGHYEDDSLGYWFNIDGESFASNGGDTVALAYDGSSILWARNSTVSSGANHSHDSAVDVTVDGNGDIHVLGVILGDTVFGGNLVSFSGFQDMYVWTLAPSGSTKSVLSSNSSQSVEIPTTIVTNGEKLIVGGNFVGTLTVGSPSDFNNSAMTVTSIGPPGSLIYAGYVAQLTILGDEGYWNWIQDVQWNTTSTLGRIVGVFADTVWSVTDILISDSGKINIAGHHYLKIDTNQSALDQPVDSGVYVGQLESDGIWRNLAGYDGNGLDYNAHLSELPNGELLLGFDSFSTRISIASHWFYTQGQDRNQLITSLSWDYDGDNTADQQDNCEYIYNPSQADYDGDLAGDYCDDDDDQDGVLDVNDTCPFLAVGPNDVNNDGCPDPSILDTDGDGVHDGIDLCPDTPSSAETLVNGTGCQGQNPNIDADGDGVHDGIDTCPNTTELYVDSNGCPQLIPPDTDDDGILDVNDDCIDTPEDIDGFEDSDGCPELDNDMDEIPDSADSCPNLAAGDGQFDNNTDGCPDYCDQNCVDNSLDNTASDNTNNSSEAASSEWWNDGDLTGELIVGGTGIIGGGALGSTLSRIKGGKKGSGLDLMDVKDAYDFIADRKKGKSSGFPDPSASDHYLIGGVARQESMAISADTALDDYVED
jgi:hypothetical protein